MFGHAQKENRLTNLDSKFKTYRLQLRSKTPFSLKQCLSEMCSHNHLLFVRYIRATIYASGDQLIELHWSKMDLKHREFQSSGKFTHLSYLEGYIFGVWQNPSQWLNIHPDFCWQMPTSDIHGLWMWKYKITKSTFYKKLLGNLLRNKIPIHGMPDERVCCFELLMSNSFCENFAGNLF